MKGIDAWFENKLILCYKLISNNLKIICLDRTWKYLCKQNELNFRHTCIILFHLYYPKKIFGFYKYRLSGLNPFRKPVLSLTLYMERKPSEKIGSVSPGLQFTRLRLDLVRSKGCYRSFENDTNISHISQNSPCSFEIEMN